MILDLVLFDSVRFRVYALFPVLFWKPVSLFVPWVFYFLLVFQDYLPCLDSLLSLVCPSVLKSCDSLCLCWIVCVATVLMPLLPCLWSCHYNQVCILVLASKPVILSLPPSVFLFLYLPFLLCHFQPCVVCLALPVSVFHVPVPFTPQPKFWFVLLFFFSFCKGLSCFSFS